MSTVNELPVKIIGCKSFDSEHGGMTYLTFVDESGARLFWRATGLFNMPIGKQVTLSGSIMNQSDDGSLQLTRCTVDGQSAGVLAGIVSPEPLSQFATAPPVEPTAPVEGNLGVAWGAVDRGMSAIARILFVLLGLSVLLPFIGLILAAIVIPTLIVVAIVLAVRRSRRAGTIQYGNRLVSQNLTWTLISLVIAVTCLILQVAFLAFLSAIGGGMGV